MIVTRINQEDLIKINVFGHQPFNTFIKPRFWFGKILINHEKTRRAYALLIY